MKSRLHTFVVVVALALSPWHASAVMAQEAVYYGHGAAEGGQVRISRAEILIGSSNAHEQLPSSALTVQLHPGDSDLFIFEFDAECLVAGSEADYLSVQARLNGVVGGSLGGSYLQPQNNPTDLEACSSAARSHTISKSWVIRLFNSTSSPQSYTFSIWVRVVGEQPIASLDNRIVRLTRYN
jgi:hypothetical protein